MRIKTLVSVSSFALLGLAACQTDGDDDTENSSAEQGEAGSGDSKPPREDDDGNGGAGGSDGSNGGAPDDGGSDEGDDAPDPGDDGDDDEPKPQPEPGNDDGPSVPAPAARFFLPSGEGRNTNAPTVKVDGRGGIHTVYPAYAGGGAYYAYCAEGCEGPGDVAEVSFDTDGTVVNAMLALDSQARPRVLLATYLRAYFASCDSDCSDENNWQIAPIVEHGGDREITGEAFALDPDGHPRFLMHTYRIPLGIGQGAPVTEIASCESNCVDGDSWSTTQIAQQIWENSDLQFDKQGRAHLGTVAIATEGELAGERLAAYARCDSDCESGGTWNGTGIVQAFTEPTAAASIHSAVSLALTSSSDPRLVVLGKTDTGDRGVFYYECDGDCRDAAGWAPVLISNNSQIGAGLDLALDAKDHPRFVYTIGYNIGMYSCEATHCSPEDVEWKLTQVESASDLPEDPIILYPNCTVSAWFLHDPSIAILPDGSPRVAYQASDVSGGFDKPNPTKPNCEAGADMTLSRLALMH